MNNPLRYTDPSGYFLNGLWHAIGKVLQSPIFRAVVAIVAIYYGYTYGFSQLVGTSAVAQGAVQGGIAGYVFTGDAKGALYGAISGAAFGYIGDQTSGWTGVDKWVGRPLLHGATGGVLSEGQGGSFKDGFVGAAFGEIASPGLGDWGNSVANTFKAALVGGTASLLTGGKFANGAVSSAYGYAFNDSQIISPSLRHH